ncbi:ABC transporter permease [Apibacter adventoris]|uniref:ABC transporter permease n=1 Tax=Apibacter adventoris TaxID=1679466 RepID=A0A2S8AF38_9FLAO|nr:ABC transporter permease [Apibacter adventoris]PQL94171.1 ABC transporter permease [Apibacter adventoris]
MRNIFLVMRREFLTQIRKKSFIIITILAPLLIILAVMVIAYMIKMNETNANIAIVDANNQFYSDFKSDRKNIYNFYQVKDINSLKDSLIHSKNLDAVLYIPKMQDSLMDNLQNHIQLYTNKNLNKKLIYSIENTINKKIENKRRIQLGLKKSDLEKINSHVNLKITNIKEGNKSDSNSTIKDVLSLSLMYVILMFIIIYGTRVMRSIMEEKNNRVVEIIISSIRPFDLMMGKILGTTLVAILQFCIWTIMTLFLLFIGQVFLGHELIVNSIQHEEFQTLMNHDTELQIKTIIDSLFELNYPLIIFLFIFFFFSGYLFYSSFFAAIGAAVDNDTETQQFMPIIVIPLLLGAYGCITIINNPEGPVAFWLSIIPFTSPMAIVTRSFYGIPLWQLILSIFIMLASVLLMVYISGKIYRVGILMYGKKVNFKEIWKWIKQS